jgi:hypothetical protein
MNIWPKVKNICLGGTAIIQEKLDATDLETSNDGIAAILNIEGVRRQGPKWRISEHWERYRSPRNWPWVTGTHRNLGQKTMLSEEPLTDSG